MADEGFNKQMDAAAKIGNNHVRTRYSPSMENEQADAERDARTGHARPNSQAQTGTWKRTFFPV